MAVDLEVLSRRVGKALAGAEQILVTAESCTGGAIAAVITDIPGSSAWFERGFVTYSNRAKEALLGVSADTLARHGAVSREVVLEMAAGALVRSPADISVAISGIAGPEGGTPDKPVGTVWIAWGRRDRGARVRCLHLEGDRLAVRIQAVACALEGVLALLAE